jgi:hypothetical protein
MGNHLVVPLIIHFALATNAQVPIISLNSASSFGVIASTSVTTSAQTTINGDLGLTPGGTLTGSLSINGSTYTGNDPVAIAARADAEAAFETGSAITNFTDISGKDLGGQVLNAGVYRFTSIAHLTGILALDAQGSATAQFIFQIASSFASTAGSSFVLLNGAQACNVFFLVGHTAGIGAGTAFAGSVLAREMIALDTSAVVIGGVYSLGGAVDLNGNAVVSPGDCVNTSCPVTTPCPMPTPCHYCHAKGVYLPNPYRPSNPSIKIPPFR